MTEDGYFDIANANKSWVRVHGGQSSEFPIYPTTLERTIRNVKIALFEKIVLLLHPRVDVPFGLVVT